MPLEFSVAAFRFGHSMIRASYELKGTTATIEQILGVSLDPRPAGQEALLEPVAGGFRLKDKFSVDWSKFVGPAAVNKAQIIDTLISRGLGSLSFAGGGLAGMVIKHLAQRNLLRGFSLGIPTGQAIAAAFGIEPLSPSSSGKASRPTSSPRSTMVASPIAPPSGTTCCARRWSSSRACAWVPSAAASSPRPSSES